MLVGLKEVLAEGKAKGIAVGSFNTPNLECLIAVLDAAEELDVPVIVAHAQIHEPIAPLDKIGPVMVALARAARVKVCVHLDHGEDEEYCRRAMDLGFTSVMIDYSTKDYEDNVLGTRRVVDMAHARGVDVESELGRLPQREGGAEDDGMVEVVLAGLVDALDALVFAVHAVVAPRPGARQGVDCECHGIGIGDEVLKREFPVFGGDAYVFSRTKRKRILHLLLDFTEVKMGKPQMPLPRAAARDDVV